MNRSGDPTGLSPPGSPEAAPNGPASEPTASIQTVARDNPVRLFMHVKQTERNTWSDADYRAAARKYDLMVLRVPDQKKVRMLKSENAALKVLLYYQSTFVNTHSQAWSEIDRHEDWFVHDTNGRRLRWKDTGWYLLNVGNSGYRQFVAQRAKNKASQFGFDGMYLDQAGFDVAGTSASKWSGPVPSSVKSNWFDWVTGFLRYLDSNAGGLRIVYNTLEPGPDGYRAINDSPHLDAVDQGNMEGFAHADWQGGGSHWSRSTWQYQLSRVKEALQKDRYFSAQAGTDSTATSQEQLKRIQEYALATYLLVADGRTVYMTFLTELSSGTDKTLYIPAYDAPIGDPSGAYTQADVAFVRAFTRGKVVVNPDDSKTVTISLGGSYRTLGGSTLSSVTLKPKTAAILTK